MQGLQSGQWGPSLKVLLPLLMLLLAACSSTGKLLGKTDTPAGFVSRINNLLILKPVSLYGLPELSLGARQIDSGETALAVCDTSFRELEDEKPLVLYLDGEYRMLRWLGQSRGDGEICHQFLVSADTLERIASAQKAILRIYFSDQPIEQRISGSVSDYLSRPKALGPQQSIRRFINALSESSLSRSTGIISPIANNQH